MSKLKKKIKDFIISRKNNRLYEKGNVVYGTAATHIHSVKLMENIKWRFNQNVWERSMNGREREPDVAFEVRKDLSPKFP